MILNGALTLRHFSFTNQIFLIAFLKVLSNRFAFMTSFKIEYLSKQNLLFQGTRRMFYSFLFFLFLWGGESACVCFLWVWGLWEIVCSRTCRFVCIYSVFHDRMTMWYRVCVNKFGDFRLDVLERRSSLCQLILSNYLLWPVICAGLDITQRLVSDFYLLRTNRQGSTGRRRRQASDTTEVFEYDKNFSQSEVCTLITARDTTLVIKEFS